MLELRHFKEKDKKMSVKCWARVAAAWVERGGSAAAATLQSRRIGAGGEELSQGRAGRRGDFGESREGRGACGVVLAL